MTIEQTIEILSQIDAYDEKEIEAIDKAKTVLERQIPRPVEFNQYTQNYQCPICGRKRKYKDVKFCGFCGQVLDWSDL
jgi:rubredoxin